MFIAKPLNYDFVMYTVNSNYLHKVNCTHGRPFIGGRVKDVARPPL